MIGDAIPFTVYDCMNQGMFVYSDLTSSDINLFEGGILICVINSAKSNEFFTCLSWFPVTFVTMRAMNLDNLKLGD